MKPTTNRYSDQWFDTFLDTIPDQSTRHEVAFVARAMPPTTFPDLLDLCCGPGRHARLLVEEGYRILGLDAKQAAIERARAVCPQARFITGDMRDLASLGQTFDGVVNLWHSFGYFDDETNLNILKQVRGILRPGGRAIFDIYNRDHFAQRPQIETSRRGGKTIHTTHSRDGARHRVALTYDGEPGDVFEWRLYSAEEFQDLCEGAGLHTIRACAWFDEDTAPSPEHARMQFVLERSA